MLYRNYAIALFILIFTTACGSGGSDNTPDTMTETEPQFDSHTCAEPGLLDDVFINGNFAECINGEPPVAVGSITIDASDILTPERNLVPGGAQQFSVSADASFFQVYVSEPGRYFKLTRAAGSPGFVFNTGFQPQLTDRTTDTIELQVASADGAVSEAVEVPLTKLDVGTGELQVSLTWSNVAHDLDLELTAPDGSVLDSTNMGEVTGGQIDFTSNDNCVIDNIHDENLFFPTGTAPRGTYAIRVVNKSLCGDTAGTLNMYEVTVRAGNEVLERFTGTNLDLEGEVDSYGFVY
jgi:hypothetical protein